MQQSLKILTDVPDYADRVNRLETLKNRLEALISPTVVAAFNNQDVGECGKTSGRLDFPRTSLSVWRHGSFLCANLPIDRSGWTVGRSVCDIRESTQKEKMDGSVQSSSEKMGTSKRNLSHRFRINTRSREQMKHVICDLDSSRQPSQRTDRSFDVGPRINFCDDLWLFLQFVARWGNWIIRLHCS